MTLIPQLGKKYRLTDKYWYDDHMVGIDFVFKKND